MPVYAYKGFDARGKPTSGVKDADSPKNLRASLKRDGIYVTEAKETSKAAAKASRARGPSAKAQAQTLGEMIEVVLRLIINPMSLRAWLRERANVRAQVTVLTRQLGTLLKAGVPLAESLGALVDQVDRDNLKRVLAEVKTKVNEGSSLADAMGEHPRVFPELYVNMVRAGEASGTLEVILFRLAEFMETQNKLRGKVISALFYPVAMIFVGGGIMALLMVSVVPKVTAIFEDTGRALPWNTQLLVWLSNFVANYWWTIPPAIIGGWVAFQRWKATPKGRYTYDKILLRLWLVGPLARQLAVTRFAKTLATLLGAGIPLLRALDIVKAIVGNSVLTKVIEEARESIKEGESIAAPLKRSGEFPSIVTHMIAVGERSGQLETMLDNVASSYELELDLKLTRLTSMLEPLMILVMGGSVAFIVFSILMPIMEMNDFVT
jgi:general secretion pathway protein F